MLKLYTIIYNCILILFIVLNFVASFIVGVAGHVSQDGTSYYIISMIFITMLFLTLYSKGILTSPIVKYLNIALVSTIAIATGYIMTLTTTDGEIILPLFIIGFLFILLSVALIKNLIIHNHTSYNY